MGNDHLCRLCLNRCQVSVSIFDTSIPLIIESLTSLKVVKGDGLPSRSCQNCIAELFSAYKVRKRIIDADHKLRKKQLTKAMTIKREESTAKKSELHITLDATMTSECDTITSQKDACLSNITKREINTSQSISNNQNYEPETSIGVTQVDIKEEPLENMDDEEMVKQESTELKIKNTKEIKPENKEYEMVTAMSDIIEIVQNRHPKTYLCKVCKVVIGRDKVQTHRSKHMKAKCKLCGMVIRADNIRKHVLIHKSGPQICDICGSLHKSIEGLRSHLFNFHTERDPYKCEHCGDEFRLSSKLWDHIRRIHTGDRPHKCKSCEKAFFSSDTLKKHVNLVHLNIRAHECEYCKKKYSSRYALKTHKRQHTGELPYICEHCCEGFRQSVSLRSHLKSKHNIVAHVNKPGCTYSQQQAKRKLDESV